MKLKDLNVSSLTTMGECTDLQGHKDQFGAQLWTALSDRFFKFYSELKQNINFWIYSQIWKIQYKNQLSNSQTTLTLKLSGEAAMLKVFFHYWVWRQSRKNKNSTRDHQSMGYQSHRSMALPQTQRTGSSLFPLFNASQTKICSPKNPLIKISFVQNTSPVAEKFHFWWRKKILTGKLWLCTVLVKA